jgi:hypothetical protein
MYFILLFERRSLVKGPNRVVVRCWGGEGVAVDLCNHCGMMFGGFVAPFRIGTDVEGGMTSTVGSSRGWDCISADGLAVQFITVLVGATHFIIAIACILIARFYLIIKTVGMKLNAINRGDHSLVDKLGDHGGLRFTPLVGRAPVVVGTNIHNILNTAGLGATARVELATEGAVVLEGQVGFIDGSAAVIGGTGFFMVNVTAGVMGGGFVPMGNIHMNAESLELLGELVQVLLREDGTFLRFFGLLLGGLILGMLGSTVCMLDVRGTRGGSRG